MPVNILDVWNQSETNYDRIKKKKKQNAKKVVQRGSNPRPLGREWDALTTTPCALFGTVRRLMVSCIRKFARFANFTLLKHSCDGLT